MVTKCFGRLRNSLVKTCSPVLDRSKCDGIYFTSDEADISFVIDL